MQGGTSAVTIAQPHFSGRRRGGAYDRARADRGIQTAGAAGIPGLAREVEDLGMRGALRLQDDVVLSCQPTQEFGVIDGLWSAVYFFVPQPSIGMAEMYRIGN